MQLAIVGACGGGAGDHGVTDSGGGRMLMVVMAEVLLPWRWSHMYINMGTPGKKDTFC